MSGKVKILLVDDESAILDTLQILFRGEGYEVAVREGLAALLLVRSEDGGFTEKVTPRFQEMFP